MKVYAVIIITALIAMLNSCAVRDARQKDILLNTRLHYAVINQNFDETRSLILWGADTNSVNIYGITPVRYAAFVGNTDMLRLLIAKGALVNNIKKSKPDILTLNILKYPEPVNNFFLTFDLGFDNGNLDYILRTLAAYKIKATFFITGQFMVKYPADVRRIVKEGHTAGSHTYNHLMNYRNPSILLDELKQTEQVFAKITGKKLSKIWRAPYLQHIGKPWMLKEAAGLGYRHIDVSLAAVDWVQANDPRYLSNEKFIDYFISGLNMRGKGGAVISGGNVRMYQRGGPQFGGMILLMHSGTYRKNPSKDFVYSLEDVIVNLIGSGYYFDECSRFSL